MSLGKKTSKKKTSVKKKSENDTPKLPVSTREFEPVVVDESYHCPPFYTSDNGGIPFKVEVRGKKMTIHTYTQPKDGL
jgi:hypothetical protein